MATAQAQAPISENDELSPYRWIILAGLITAAILEVLDTTIVNVALPQMAGNLGATTQEIGWVSTGYILSNVVVLPMTAWLSSRFGRKRYLAGSIILFLIASFFCGTSRTLGELVVWRILQGAGGAALLSTAQATIREIFPKEQQGLVQSIYVLGIITAPTLGPTLGGWITDNYSWPWVFFVNLPIGLISLLIVTSFLEDAKHRVQTTQIDWWGIGFLTVGIASLQYVLEEGNIEDWFASATITRLAIAAFISLVAFVWWELSPKNNHPIVNLRVLKNRDLSASLILFLALGFGLYGGIFIFPLFAQSILHFTPTVTGLVLMPGAVATGVSAILCGRLLNGKKQMLNPRIIIVFGMVLFIYSMWDLGHLTTMSGEPDTRLALIIRGFGLGCLFTPINLAAFSSLEGVEIAQGASLLNLMRQLGGSFGIAYLGTHISNQNALHMNTLSSYLYVGNPAFDERMQSLQNAMMGRGYDAQTAHQLALSIIERTVQTQSQVMSYNDAFLFIGLTMIIVAPCVLLLRSGNAAVSTAEMGH
ncbi:MFS transporter, DHA2 family, multidrug resistance protein [Abditibacterium utsteinense]|uniref:MFS transporter, DHA2 family, multidrug resistance protein n=1 Tax=Abditibacterium utsteinense TaxID=1960156 RepID=A0A2S8SRU8_9BACT|nr:DHA2 family efflux MFS transporter permease subunit [Abditibacterium utsteinense]PQV63531.1 MFS transporter, DHA2 family, multidrug resistance protein [Abditibacterium utsteinense]